MNAEPASVVLRINGREARVAVEAGTPLIDVLRNELGLVGTRFGCGAEACGACLVLLDGAPACACTTPVESAAGRDVATVEGLSAGGAMHPVQQALLEANAGQCGYCLSGIVMRCVAVLREHPAPTEAQVRLALDPHLCRCGSHNRIVRAVLAAAGAMATR